MTLPLSERVAQLELTVSLATQARQRISAAEQEIQALEGQIQTLRQEQQGLHGTLQEAVLARATLDVIAAHLDGTLDMGAVDVAPAPPAPAARDDVNPAAPVEQEQPEIPAEDEPYVTDLERARTYVQGLDASSVLTVASVVDQLGISPSSLTKHLRTLEKEGLLVKVEGTGKPGQPSEYRPASQAAPAQEVPSLPVTPEPQAPEPAASEPTAAQPTPGQVEQILQDLEQHPGSTAWNLADRLNLSGKLVRDALAILVRRGDVRADDSTPPEYLALTVPQNAPAESPVPEPVSTPVPSVSSREETPATPEKPLSKVELPAHLRPVPANIQVTGTMVEQLVGTIRVQDRVRQGSTMSESMLIARMSRSLNGREVAATIRAAFEQKQIRVAEGSKYGLPQT